MLLHARSFNVTDGGGTTADRRLVGESRGLGKKKATSGVRSRAAGVVKRRRRNCRSEGRIDYLLNTKKPYWFPSKVFQAVT